MSEFRAVVQRIVHEGEHGPFAFSTLDPGLDFISGSVTFSLSHPVWDEEHLPEPGTFVMLSSLSRKTAGWRAARARLYTPEDEQNFKKQDTKT